MVSKLVLLPNDQYGMGIYARKEIIATSKAVADMFNKRHADVLRAIENCECSNAFRERNFAFTSYKDEQNKKQPMCLLTKNGFAFVVLGFTGKKAAQFKEAYIVRYEEMEAALQERQRARMECKQLTDSIKLAHDPARQHHFSNEMNMLLVIVTGKNAKQLIRERDLPDDAGVRDYLSPNEISLLAALQPVAAFLNVTTPDYHERKRLLIEYAGRIRGQQLISSAV